MKKALDIINKRIEILENWIDKDLNDEKEIFKIQLNELEHLKRCLLGEEDYYIEK